MYILSILLGTIQLLLIGYILYKEVMKKSPAVFLWATLMIMFGFPHMITVVFERMGYPTYVLMEASVFVIGFCFFYLIIRSKLDCSFLVLADGHKLRLQKSELERSAFERVCFIVFLISIVGYIIYIINAQGGIWNASWASARTIERDYISLSGLAHWLIFAFSGFSLYYYLTDRKFSGFFVLLLFMVLVIITRNRVQILPVLIFPIVLYLLKIKMIRIKHIVWAIAIAFVVLYIIYAIRAFRYLGSFSNAVDHFSWNYINTTVGKFLRDNNGELGLRQYFYYFIQHNNNFEGFNHGYTYIRMLLVFIPSRFSFGLKPQSFDLYMGQATGMASGGSMHPTLFGDCFGNLYWFGILLGAFWALLANGVDKLIGRQEYDFFKIMIYFLAGYAFVVIGRGSVYNGFLVMAWGVLFLWLIKVLLKRLISVNITFGTRKMK